MEARGIVIERVRLLAKQLAATIKPGTGEKQRLAKALGVSPSLLSKIEGEGKAHLRDDMIISILDTVGLEPAFLFDRELGAKPDYREHLRKPRPTPARRDPPHWRDFAKAWPRYGELTPAERDGLRGMIGTEHTIRHWTDWIEPAKWVLAQRSTSPD